MDIVFLVLLFLHIVALVVGTATNVVMPLLGAIMPRLAPEARAEIGGATKRLTMNSRGAVTVLILTGIAMMVVRYNGVEGAGPWFWAKMAAVVALVVMMIVTSVVPREKLNPKIAGMAMRLILLFIILSALLAFR